MEITVTPIDNNLTNCFIPVCVENVLSEYLNYKGYEYHYAFAYALDFQFDKAKCHTDRVADGLNSRILFYGLVGKNIWYKGAENILCLCE